MSERTGSFFYRHRFPEEIIKIAIFYHLFIPSAIVQIFLIFLFRCYVSKKSICKWTEKYLNNLPDISLPSEENLLRRRHTDEKQIKIKGKKAWWWNIVDSVGNPLESCLSWTRHGFVVNQFMKNHKKKYGSPEIMVTDGLLAYIQGVKKLGRRCQHVIAGLEEKIVYDNKRGVYIFISNLSVERLHSKIDYYIDMKFRGSFENMESADRWRKAFMLTNYLRNLVPKYKETRNLPCRISELMC
jgi:transposase-like protein